MSDRPSWDQYYLNMLTAIAERSTCDRGKVACILVKDNHIVSTGYSGAPKGLDDCFSSGHIFEERISESGNTTKHCIRTIHAEQNAIAYAAKKGISIEGSTAYCTMEPCFNCAKIIIATGIKRVISRHSYVASELTKDLFKQCQIEFETINHNNLY